MLMNLIDKKKLTLELHNPKWIYKPLIELLKNDDVFSTLPEKILTVIDENLSSTETFNSN